MKCFQLNCPARPTDECLIYGCIYAQSCRYTHSLSRLTETTVSKEQIQSKAERGLVNITFLCPY